MNRSGELAFVSNNYALRGYLDCLKSLTGRKFPIGRLLDQKTETIRRGNGMYDYAWKYIELYWVLMHVLPKIGF